MVNGEFAYLQLSYQQRDMRVAASRGPRQRVRAHEEQRWLGLRDDIRVVHTRGCSSNQKVREAQLGGVQCRRRVLVSASPLSLMCCSIVYLC
jgi:hypothetical protein